MIEENNVIGTVTAISNKNGKYGVCLNKDTWFNGDGECPVSKGNVVEINFIKNGQWNNVVEIKKIDENTIPPKKEIDNKKVLMLTSYVKDLLIARPELKTSEAVNIIKQIYEEL